MLKRIFSLFSRRRRRQAAWIAVTVFIRSLLDFVGVAALVPVIFLIARHLGSDRRIILLLCCAVMLFVMLKDVAVYFLVKVQTKFQTDLFRDFSRRMFVNYYRRGMMFLKSESSARLAYQVNGIAMIFSQSIMGALLSLAGEIVLVACLSVALVIWKPAMGGIIFAIFVPAAFAYSLAVKKKIKALGDSSLKAQRAQSRNVIETFRGYAELEIAGAFSTSLNSFDSNLSQITKNRITLDLYRLMPSFISEVGFIGGLMALVAFAGDDPLFTAGVFAMAAFKIIPSVRGALNNWATIQNHSSAIDIVEQGVRENNDACYDSDVPPLPFARGLVANRLGFSYPDGKVLFRNLSFTISPGERIGIKGRSGAGKSTLFNLLLGFFRPTEGEILIDDQPLRGENRRAWHNTLGYVPQEIFIIDGSLAQNIALGDENIDRDKVMHILSQVQLREWAEALPEGIDTNLGEYGSRLSGGQKQRIGIARALYKGATVLFFDEATSSLDSATEKEINRALKQLSDTHSELTMIIIAHRESSLQFCSRIINLDEYNDNEI